MSRIPFSSGPLPLSRWSWPYSSKNSRRLVLLQIPALPPTALMRLPSYSFIPSLLSEAHGSCVCHPTPSRHSRARLQGFLPHCPSDITLSSRPFPLNLPVRGFMSQSKVTCPDQGPEWPPWSLCVTAFWLIYRSVLPIVRNDRFSHLCPPLEWQFHKVRHLSCSSLHSLYLK